jgi:hypothetical protein
MTHKDGGHPPRAPGTNLIQALRRVGARSLSARPPLPVQLAFDFERPARQAQRAPGERSEPYIYL